MDQSFVLVLMNSILNKGCNRASLLFALGIHDCVLQFSRSPGVLWSGWYADDGTIHAPLSVLDHVYSALVSSLAATKSRVVTCNVAQIDLFPNLRGLRKIPLHDGFQLLGGFYPGTLLICF